MTKLYFALIFSILLIITGCSEKTSDEYIALAETKIQQEDFSTAIIELKNAISVNTQEPKSRFMLGSLYAQRGSSAAAEKELLRAFELGYEPNEVLPVLANVYSLQSKNAEIIKLVDEARSLTPEVTTSLLLYKSLAHFQLGEPYKAKKAVTDANEISSDSLYSKLGNAYVDFSNKQIHTSLEKIEEILAVQPDFADAHLLKGQLTSVSEDTEGAVESFEKYKELLPETFQARVFLANAFLKNKQYKEAEEEIDLLLKVNPEQPFINQLKGAVRFQADDFINAKLYSEKAIQNGNSSVSNKMVAGVSAFRLQNFEQSYTHINSIKDQLPQNSPIKKLLTVLQLNLGLGSEAEQTLLDIEGLNENDIILLSAASTQLLKSGEFEKAKKLADLADTLEFTNALNLIQKGLLRLSFNEVDGINDLEDALQLDPELSSGNTALARAYIDNGFYDKALDLSKVWIEQKPNKVNGYVLAAVSLINKDNIVEAEKMYEKAMSIDKANPAANIYFADKNEAAGNSKDSVDYLYEVLKVYPNNLSALKKYFVLNQRLGSPEKGMSFINNAVDKAPTNSKLILLQVRALYSEKQYTQITKAIDTSMVVSDGQIWEILANAYLKLGNGDESERVLQHWREKQPNNRNAFISSINLLDVLGSNQKALKLVREAFKKFESDIRFRVLAAYFYMKNKQIPEAKSTFNTLPKEIKDAPAGKGLQAKILLANGEHQRALILLKELHNIEPSENSAILITKTLKSLNNFSGAFDFLTLYIKNHASTKLIDSQLAELLILNGNYEDAEESYKSILQADPNNAKALNNLANILMIDNRIEEAIPLAKKAAELLPESPSVLDTYSQILRASGQDALALTHAQKAYDLNNSSITLSLNVAELLISNNKSKEASEIIDAITDTAPDTVARIKLIRNKL
jgi:putative PEP-CTERM system TPR-repeat lipoprotein